MMFMIYPMSVSHSYHPSTGDLEASFDVVWAPRVLSIHCSHDFLFIHPRDWQHTAVCRLLFQAVLLSCSLSFFGSSGVWYSTPAFSSFVFHIMTFYSLSASSSSSLSDINRTSKLCEKRAGFCVPMRGFFSARCHSSPSEARYESHSAWLAA
jgi:hypothetical protein